MGVRLRSSHYLAATVGSSAIAFASLPLTTRILGPPNYGEFALGVAVAGAGATLATLGSGYVINARLPKATPLEARAAVSSVAANALVIALGWAALVSALFFAVGRRWEPLGEIDTASFALAVAATILLPVWIIATDVLTLQGRSARYAAVALAQGVVATATTLLCLYALDLAGVALFVGYFAGTAIAAVGGFGVLRPYLSLTIERIPRDELAQSRFLLAQVLDAAHTLAERMLLSASVGFGRLGLYTHSQSYRTYAFQATKAVARGVWPVTLQEAADTSSRFEHTRRVWNAVHVALTVVGTGMILLGYVLVGWLTNGKFVGAAVYFAPWFILILLQNLARPETATIYAFGSGREVARLGVWANAAALVGVFALVPSFGPEGAVIALLAQATVFRSLVRVTARRYRSIPFQDGWAVLGMVVLTGAFVVDRYLDPELHERLLVCVALQVAILVVALPVIRDVVQGMRRPRATSVAQVDP